MEHQLEKIVQCPICKKEVFDDYLSCVDHNVSQDVFNIVECKNCKFKFTNPRPKKETIGKYYQSKDYISHTSSKKGLFNLVYQGVRKYQFRKKLSIINSLVNNEKKSLLDVGCGTGEFVSFCNKNHWNSKGVETDTKARSFAINKNKCEVDESLDAAIRNEEQYDIITLWHVLEHVYDLDDYLKKLKSLLKKGGYLILGLPNHRSYDAKYFESSWFAYDLPIHVSHFSKTDIKKIVKKYNFTSLKARPLIFDAYYISLLSSKKSNKTILHGFFIGLISNIKAIKTKEYSSQMYIIGS